MKKSLRFLAVLGSVLMSAAPLFAGSADDDKAGKEIVKQADKDPFPVHVFLRGGYDSAFIFRGVDILPEKTLNLPKANRQAIKAIPEFVAFLSDAGSSVPEFVAGLTLPKRVKVAKTSNIGYFDGDISYTNQKIGTFTLGAFYALQTTPRIDPHFFGDQSFFTEYKETDLFGTYSRSFGPVSLSLGGTWYHVDKNSSFDTAELNFSVSYTPPQFRYVTASLTYNYASAYQYKTPFPTERHEYFDGHDVEIRISGDIPIKTFASFRPYVLVTAGSGIIPRSFNTLTLPTYFSDQAYAAALVPVYRDVFNQVVNGLPPASTTVTAAQAQQAFNARQLDRDFDLSNFQVGFKVPIYLGKYVTLTPHADYSRPLAGLQQYPYSQKDQIWGGVSMSFAF